MTSTRSTGPTLKRRSRKVGRPSPASREEGKVRWIGVSNFNVEQMKRALKIAPITSLQPPYSMLRRAIEAEILPFAQANGIGVINYSPMVSGLLTGKMTAERVAALPAGRLAPPRSRVQ